VGFAGPSGAVDVELAIEVDGAATDRVRIRRGFMGPGIAREPVRDDGLVGTFFAPADRTARPGVLVVGGSDGGLSEGMAALLASHGFAALALAYFRAEHLPPDLTEIPLEYFETAIRWLGRQPSVAAGGLGVVGRSRGGELALLLAATFPEITAVVGYVPSGVVHAGIRRLARRGSRTALGLDLPRESRCPSCRLRSTGRSPGPRPHRPRLRSS
jgi:acetyl esterase/lipase